MARAYEVVTVDRRGTQRAHRYTADHELGPGEVLRLDGRFWLIAELEPAGEADLAGRARATAARYRMRLRHPDGREELGAFRRFRPDAPRVGHAFTTLEDGTTQSWQVVDGQVEVDDNGEPYLELVAERDFAEVEGDPPDHELEHALARSQENLPVGASDALAQAMARGEALELVALEPGEAPDWQQAQEFLDALVFEEIGDDLFVLCGVDTRNDPRDTWLDTVKARLRQDLERFRADIESDHDQIEEWDFLDGRLFASVGTRDDEADPDKGHGWMCRLLDAELLGAAGFVRVRKAELLA
jgi:hypothetical protein